MEGPSFEFVEHTADIAVRLRAPSLEGLFEAAAVAFTEAVTDAGAVGTAVTRDIALEAGEPDLLLVDWLGELLFLFETEALLVAGASVDIVAGERCALRATVSGERRDAARHPLKLLIKAVTYHGLHIERASGGYVATVIFDV